MACGGFICAKNALIALNVLYLMVAGILIGVAAWSRLEAVITSVSIIGGIISCGVFLFLIALVGLVGAVKHHQVSLFFYMIILFLIFVVQFAVACALLAISQQQQLNFITSHWENANKDTKKTVQSTFQCCGLTDADQGLGPHDPKGHPSCFHTVKACKDSPAFCCTGVKTNATTTTETPCPVRACMRIIEENIDQGVKATGGVGLFFSFTEIIGVLLAFRFRNMKDPRANPNAFL